MHATKQIQRRNAVHTKNRINGLYQDDVDFENTEYERMIERMIEANYEERYATDNICMAIAGILIKRAIKKRGEEKVNEDYIWWDYFSDYGHESYYYQYQAEGYLEMLEKKGHTRNQIRELIAANAI